MALTAKQIDGAGDTTSTITVTKTGPLQLTFAGTWTEPDPVTGNPVSMVLASTALDFTSDPTDVKDYIVMFLHDAAATPATDLLKCGIKVDAALIKDATSAHSKTMPGNYRLVCDLAWCLLPAGATDLDSTTVYWLQVT